MKRLYENIEDIHIKGNPAELTSVISAMDISLQNIAAGTEQVFGMLLKYSSSNMGAQYEKAMNTAISLRDVLARASVDLNAMQNDVVAYQNKIFRYEDMTEYAATPNAYMVERTMVTVDSSTVRFSLYEMESVVVGLQNYSEAIVYHTRNLIANKDQIASIWCDTQYTLFSEFIDAVCGEIVDALKSFDEYVSYLEQKIKELN